MLDSHSKRKKALAVGCSAHVIQDGLGAAIYVLLPILAQTFGLGYAQIGLFKGAMNLSQAILELSSGFLSERIGNAQTLVFGMAVAGLGYLSLAAVDQTSVLLMCLLIVGVGTAFQHAPASTLVSQAYASEGQRSALGLYNSSGDVGKLLFAACFSLSIGAGLAWQHIAFSFGLIAILAAIAVALALPSLPQPPLPTPKVSQSTPTDVSSYWGIINRRSFTTLLIVIFLDNLVQAGVLVFVAFAMISKGIPLFFATMATVVVLIGGTFGKAGCGLLAQRLGTRRAFVLIQFATVVCLIAFIVAPPWVAFGLLLPLGVVSQGSTSITYGLIPDLIHPERLARGYALMYSLTSFASAIGPFSFGLTADQFGINYAFFAMAVITLVSSLPMIFFPLSKLNLSES